MNKKIYIVCMAMLLVTFALALTNCEEDDATNTTTIFTYYFINNSSYDVTVGGVTDTISPDDYRNKCSSIYLYI